MLLKVKKTHIILGNFLTANEKYQIILGIKTLYFFLQKIKTKFHHNNEYFFVYNDFPNL